MAVVQERSLGCARDDVTWEADRFTRAVCRLFRRGADRFTRVVCRLFRRWYPCIAAFPSRRRCPAGADRVTMV